MKALGMLHGTPMRRLIDPEKRGYHAVYRENEVNHCPGCGRTHWFVGRVSAECAFCGTALDLNVADRPAARIYQRGRQIGPKALKRGR